MEEKISIERKPGEKTDTFNLRKLEEAFNGEAEEIDISLPKEETTQIIKDYNPNHLEEDEEKPNLSGTQSFKIGEAPRHGYLGSQSPDYAARDVLAKEHRLNELKEGALVEIVLGGYHLSGLDQTQGKKTDKRRQKQDTRVISLGENIGIGACYKIEDKPHPHGGTYRWVVPAIKGENYPETISEFLIADEECKALTPEERLKSTIYIQITRISEEELQDRLDNPLRAHQTNGFEPGQTGQSYEMKDEDGNVTKKVTPEDVAEMRRKMEESETQAENKLNDFFSEKPKNPTITLKSLSERLNRIKSNDFKF